MGGAGPGAEAAGLIRVGIGGSPPGRKGLDVSIPEGKETPVALRSPGDVMTLAAMGANHQNRLSFMRVLLRRLKREAWTFSRPVWRMNAEGYGTAVYCAAGPQRTYSLVAFSDYLPEDQRTDRVIAHQWDATFALFDGAPDEAEIERLRANIPKQEAGRVWSQVISVSRANRSVRMFDHVVDALAAGRQPDADRIEEIGYLMRTTAVYGSGKLGAGDFDRISGRPEMASPFQAEMLSVYLTREFTLDLVEHIARMRSPATAVTLASNVRRRFGVGNSTGLGLAPYLVNHPVVLGQWVMAREMALARVRSLPQLDASDRQAFGDLVERASRGLAEWKTSHPVQRGRIDALAQDLVRLVEHVERGGLSGARPWDALYLWGDRTLSLEGRELLVSLMMERLGERIDDLEAVYHADEAEAFAIDGSPSVAATRRQIEANYDWALRIDFDDPAQTRYFWYASQEKLEPRLGERREEPGAELELPLGVARDVQSLYRALSREPDDASLADFMLAHPEHRHVARRVQISSTHPYAEIRDNLLQASLYPVDLLRFKLACFGATRFDPRSDRWVRITMFRHAPFASELADGDADDWFLPKLS